MSSFAVQTNGDGGFRVCSMVLKYRILTFLIMNKMLKYFVLPLMVSFSHNWQLKTSNFEKNVMFPDTGIFRTKAQTDRLFFKILTYIHMTHVKFLFHRLSVSETQTDRQTDIHKRSERQKHRDRDGERESGTKIFVI